MKILPILTNLKQEIPDSPTGEIYLIYIWLDLMQSEVWAEADKESLADNFSNIYSWKIPLMSDANTILLMHALKSRFVVMIENHIQESTLTPDTVKNNCHWKLNAAGMQANCDIDRYLKLFCGYINK